MFVSLGSNCCISYQLKKYNLRYESYPFDWCLITFNQLINVLENNFDNYVLFSLIKNSDNHENFDLLTKSSLLIKNYYNIKFAHELNNDSENELDIFKETVERRIERFKNLNNITFIRIELKRINNYNIDLLINSLNKYIKKYNLILILYKETKIDINKYNNINVYYYDNFSNDWMMNNINWNSILL